MAWKKVDFLEKLYEKGIIKNKTNKDFFLEFFKADDFMNYLRYDKLKNIT